MKAITGYVGVIDGEPRFEKFCDEHGDSKALHVYPTPAAALERWARARRVRIMVDPKDIEQPQSKGHI